jgi:predicted transcriptional regulator
MKLNTESKITMVKTGKFIRLFPNSGGFDEDEKVIVSYLRNETSMMQEKGKRSEFGFVPVLLS